MSWFGKKKRQDDLSKKRNERKKVPYKKCGHKRTYTAKGGSIITVYCQQNANLPHRHD